MASDCELCCLLAIHDVLNRMRQVNEVGTLNVEVAPDYDKQHCRDISIGSTCSIFLETNKVPYIHSSQYRTF